MRILSLRFNNLNSLYGEWFLDFTHPEYLSGGIFAITGPTGAGKSTILDAVCLALYGKTPRLKVISKNTNEIMSRQTGDCFAEVTFQTQKGKYRCHWRQHKARRKADGNLAESRHEIADADTGKIIASKKKEVAAEIEKRTGMDFDRFTRSMLLAQGGFSAFLEATPDQRSPILEQITGTEIYSEISKRVHQRQRDENDNLRMIEARLKGVAVFTEEEENAAIRALESVQQVETDISAKYTALTRSVTWLEGINALEREIADIEKEYGVLSEALNAFEPERARLERARKAAALESDFAALFSEREMQKRDLVSLEKSLKQLPEKKKALEIKEKELGNAEDAAVEIKREQKKELELIKKVRDLDLRISEKRKTLKSTESDCLKIENQVLQKKSDIQKTLSARKEAEKNLTVIEEYIAANAGDEILVTELAGIREQVNNLQTEARRISESEKQVSLFKKQFTDDDLKHAVQEKLCGTMKKKRDACRRKTAEIKNSIETLLSGRLLREYRAEHDSLLRERAFLNKIASLEQERASLEDGKPCPLCGSLSHPYAEGNIPELDAAERKIKKLSAFIEEMERRERDLKKQESDERVAADALHDAEKQLVFTLSAKKESFAGAERVESELGVSLEKYAEKKMLVRKRLDGLGVTDFAEDRFEDILGFLEKKRSTWQDHQKQKIQIEDRLKEISSLLSGTDQIHQNLKETLSEKTAILEAHKRDRDALVSERIHLYDEKNPDAEETRFENFVLIREKRVTEARNNRDIAKQAYDELKTIVASMKENTEKRIPKINSLESSFVANCKKYGFENEAEFLSCRLAAEDRNVLSTKAKTLDDRKLEIEARKKDRAARILAEKEKKITEASYEKLKTEQNSANESLAVIREEIGAVKQKITDNTNAKTRHKEILSLAEAQREECLKWDQLHYLIGSSDGKKYRNFAQGITFEIMVSHANRQLEKMSDRYLLLRDSEQPLELNVMDNYQAGEIRSSKNLSGGESFIVSLSLALGLSKMSSRRVRVDSLFLDEGFGTLDDESLDTALEALSSLHQDGKLIGIISHVSALKERIGTRIEVNRLSGGKSEITGPGCSSAL